MYINFDCLNQNHTHHPTISFAPQLFPHHYKLTGHDDFGYDNIAKYEKIISSTALFITTYQMFHKGFTPQTQLFSSTKNW